MNIRLPFRHLRLAAGLALASAGLLPGAEAGVEFTGFMRDDQGLVIALRDKATGNSKWVPLGREFAGYTALRLEEKEGILVVARDKVEYRLMLMLSKIKQVAAEPPPELKKKVLNNLRQLSAAADQFYLENGVSTTTYEKLVGPTNYVKGIKPADGENYQALRFEQGRTLEVTTNQGYVIAYLP